MSASIPTPADPSPPTEPLYRRIGRFFETQIRSGVLAPGERLPSVRRLAQQQEVSTTTAVEAYLWLERRGRIESRPRSGFYVRREASPRLPLPAFRAVHSVPRPATLPEVVDEVLEPLRPGEISLGAAVLAPTLLPLRRLNRAFRRVLRELPGHSADYHHRLVGDELRRQIARRVLVRRCGLAPEGIVLTCGAMEALTLALRAAVSPGGVVAVESPTYYGVLQAISALGLEVVGVPCCPRDGISLPRLEEAIERRRVEAVVVMPCGHNPLGMGMRDAAKQQLVELVTQHRVALVEDDVYGELALDGEPSRLAKSFDHDERVLLCSSVSKSLGGGLRVGWLHSERYAGAVRRLQRLTTLAGAVLPQAAVAELMRDGSFERHLLRLRATLRQQLDRYAAAVTAGFPPGTALSRPTAGFALWVELPRGGCGLDVYRRALAAGIRIVPGTVFSLDDTFDDCLRLSCGQPFSAEIGAAIEQLGRMAC